MTAPPIPELVTAGILLGCLWSVLCRLAALPPTRETVGVALQHAALGFGIFGGLVLPGVYMHFSIALGLAVYLAAGAPRWRHGAPGELGKRSAR